MIAPKNFEELASLLEKSGRQVLFFSAEWCGDCRYIKPFLPEIEAENPEFTFILVDRDAFIDLTKKWDIFGIPSLILLENGQEIGRFVSKNRKNKAEIQAFLEKMK
ncbi:thioredoxin family protein [Streptococcus massiliensis]|uniref:Thioredoxin family protein n=1 Tax=Streptococcus massiliensis TaxID=313439 RepID=A0A380KZR5_9STRE|nr:thioredoxin family protein [Streptococcus massiliensis]SUN76426.1 thioredoxin family protein [Streptococcus massiliensis]